MGYTEVENALLAVIRKLAVYTTENSSAGDFSILARGRKRYVVTQPGAIRDHSVAQSPRRMRTVWVVNISLLIPFSKSVAEIAQQIRADRQELIDHIDKYPTLDSTTGIVLATIESSPEPEEWVGEHRNLWLQVLRLVVEERATITIAE